MLPDELKLTRVGPVAVLTLDRTERRNALSAPMWEGLRRVPEALADSLPRVLIVHGAGEHFSAGMDLSFDNPLFMRVADAMQRQDAEGARALVREVKRCLAGIASLPCPVIAAIEGACAGSGLELALAADLRVASDTAFFSLPELQVGLVPDVGGTVRLSRVIGQARASELVLTGRRIDAPTALAWGLVHRVTPAGGALDAAMAMAREILASAPIATQAVLPVLRRVGGLDDTAAFDAETEAGVTAILWGDAMEGAMSFLQRRRPSWVEDLP